MASVARHKLSTAFRLWAHDTFGPGELNLYLVRHMQTEGNVNREVYKKISDHAILPTNRGWGQANRMGAFLAAELFKRYKDSPRRFSHVRVHYSPYYRTRLTAVPLIYHLDKAFNSDPALFSYREADLLYEQKAGLFDGKSPKEYAKNHPDEAAHYQKCVDHCGRAYGKAPMGDSQMDVVLRIKPFFGTVIDQYRHRKKGLLSTGAIKNVVIICHGVTEKAFVKGWMQYPVEWLDAEKTPSNCSVRHIHGSQFTGYKDKGYIYGDSIPLYSPSATQRNLNEPRTQRDSKGTKSLTGKSDRKRDIIILKPQRDGGIIPAGARVIDPTKTDPRVSLDRYMQ